MTNKKRIIVAITGASGSIFGIRTLQALLDADIETHVIVSKWGLQTIQHETGMSIEDIKKMSSQFHSPSSLGAAVSSGSFRVNGMIIVPCSMRTLSAIAHGAGDNLVHRAADVVLKEQLPLVIVPRESPLNPIHLTNMLALAKMNVSIVPPMPAFYNHPKDIDDVINYIVVRILDQLSIHTNAHKRWHGNMK